MKIDRSEISSRESQTPDEFYERYYQSRGYDRVLIIELLRHLELELEIPPGKVLPSDRFSIELASGRGVSWDTGYGILLYELKKLADKKRVAIESPVSTVDDYLCEMAKVY